MDWDAVNAVFDALPSTYRRSGTVYTDWQASLVSGVDAMTSGTDSIITQTDFYASSGSWIDVWGRMLAVIRNSDECDPAYKNRISKTVTAWRGTVPGIESYVLLAEGIQATVTENFPVVGWSLILQPGEILSVAQKAALPGNLAFVRPAGVPYSVYQTLNGLFLTTGNFLGTTHFPGSWLRPPAITGLNIPQTTNNTVPTIPTTWLTDPTINPSLA